jgi:GH15 family glucan-1,4-alpha-glucosidase
MYHYGLIGNCQASALISEKGSIDWLCFPRPDSEPIFGGMLDSQGGSFSVVATPECGNLEYKQEYIPNTNVLQTFAMIDGVVLYKITDYCPRFEQHGRIYRPNSVFRVLEPVSGSPSVRISCNPVEGWNKIPAQKTRGNSHVRFEHVEGQMRLTTNMPLTYLLEETSFVLKEKIYFALTWNLGIEDDLSFVAENFLKNTIDYWRTWVKHCSVPTLYQKETIRSALTLKLHCYEDTGAILAGLTTSLPEELGTQRNWDYRFCWLRDAYFALSAFHNLGHFEEMEGFLKFLINIAHRHESSPERLHPVYTLNQGLPLPENTHDNWNGFQGSGPVRSNNQAAEHIQNDVYGEMILTLAPIFFDERFNHLRTKEHEELLSNLGVYCARSISQPDAGLWEIRNGWQEHSFSNLMCWAGLERLLHIQKKGYLKNISINIEEELSRAEASVRSAVVAGSLRNGPSDNSFDASLSQLPILRFSDVDLNHATVTSIMESLSAGPGFYYRYLRNDDFGKPNSSFVICSFWIVQALARLGRVDEANHVMLNAMTAANSLGLYSEHFLSVEKIQSGNFPQAYSHVGQINAAFAVSPPWDTVL